ncbi:MAG TPA: thioesterase family protein [Deltaproteobacteria bacterium]|nr:thioesterase family protein [Deltaproteobacteria bacterium]
MSQSFDVATTWSTGPDGEPTLELDPGWGQGRTTFGGLVAAAALRAMRTVAPERALRALSVCFVGPTGAGPLRPRVQLLRRGRSVAQVRCDLTVGEAIVATLVGVFCDAGSSTVVRRPRIEPPARGGGLVMPYIEGITPCFTQHIELCWTDGGLPFSGNDRLEHAGWCRHRAAAGPAEAAILGLLDAWPAPALQALRGHAPASTVTWTVHLLRIPATITPDDWFYLQARVVGAEGDGLCTMRAELYDEAGGLIAHLEQLVALYG